MIESALRYRVQAPMIDQVLKEIGIEGGSLAQLGGLMREASRHAARRQGGRCRQGQGDRRRAGAARAAGSGGATTTPRAAEDRRWHRVYVSSVIAAPAAKVWSRVRDFNGLPNWHPAIAESRIENGEPSDKVGCVRDFRLRNGDRIRERLLGLSDYDMFCTYSILELPMGVDNYVATLRLTPVTDGERTFVEWTAEFDCAPERESELVTMIGTNVFQGGFDSLKRQLGG